MKLNRSLGIPALIAFAALALMGADGDSPVTFSSFLTPTGVVAAAAVVTTLIQLIKGVFPAIDARISGALLAFILTGILYILTAVSVGVADANAGLAIFLAWLACATSAVGIKSATTHAIEANSGNGGGEG